MHFRRNLGSFMGQRVVEEEEVLPTGFKVQLSSFFPPISFMKGHKGPDLRTRLRDSSVEKERGHARMKEMGTWGGTGCRWAQCGGWGLCGRKPTGGLGEG